MGFEKRHTVRNGDGCDGRTSAESIFADFCQRSGAFLPENTLRRRLYGFADETRLLAAAASAAAAAGDDGSPR